MVLKFVCWLWRGREAGREAVNYGPVHVDRLRSMLARHGGHELVCVHSRDFDLDGPVLPDDVAALPSFLPKLWAWSPEFHELIGPERFVSIDLDVVILGDVAPVLTGDFRIWDYAGGEHYNTSLFVLRPGLHQEVWSTLTPERLAAVKRSAPKWTGDQTWVSAVLGPGQPTFGERDGIVCYLPGLMRAKRPKGALAAFFCGPFDPRGEAQRSPWVREAWA